MTLEERLKIFKDRGYKYNPETGVIESNNKIITYLNKGYIILSTKCNGRTINVKGHQFAWYMFYNEVPIDQVDHWDLNKSNNKISNLRCLSNQKNHFNTNSKGYYFDKRRNKYCSKIKLNNKQIFLGQYDTPEEAHQAYLDAKKIYHII